MKKYLSVALFLFLFTTSCWADYVGVIEADSVPDSCQIYRESRQVSCETRILYFGDRVHTGVSIENLRINLAAIAKMVKDELGGYWIQPAGQKIDDGAISSFIDNFLGKEEHYGAITAVRGSSSDRAEAFLKSIKVTPPAEATVLLNVPIVFKWRKGEGEELVIEDDTGKIVFSQPLAEVGSYELIPLTVSLNPGQTYTWYYSGDVLEERYQLNLIDLNKGDHIEVLAKLKSLPEIKGLDDVIYTAAYLQAVSDVSQELDFYWLSYQILPQSLEGLSKQQRTMVLNLINRYYTKTK